MSDYVFYEETVIESYNTGELTPVMLKAIISPYVDADMDHGKSQGLTTSDGLDADEVVVKLMRPDFWETYDRTDGDYEEFIEVWDNILKQVPPSSPMRKLAKIQISFELLSEILSGRAGLRQGYRIETTAPDDLKIVALFPNPGLSSAWMYCESASFESVSSMKDAPEVEPFEYSIVKVEINCV